MHEHLRAGMGFRVEIVDYAATGEDLRHVRETVFVQEQRVPAALEWDGLDPDCIHALARDTDGCAIGTGRLVPAALSARADALAASLPETDTGTTTASAAQSSSDHDHPTACARIGRMAVLAEWRNRGVGEALLAALIAEALKRRLPALALHAQASAIRFYARHGFVPQGPRFMEAGIEHQTMLRRLTGPTAVETREAAAALTAALIAATRRELSIYSRNLDPGLFDNPQILDALRRLATRRQRTEIRILLQDAGAAQRGHAPLLTLAQRLPSVFAFRQTQDPVDRDYPSAYTVNDDGGYLFRPLGHRFDGEGDLCGGGRARQLLEAFQPVWERSRPCTELRALEI